MSNETEKNLFYENKNQYSSLSETDKKIVSLQLSLKNIWKLIDLCLSAQRIH